MPEPPKLAEALLRRLVGGRDADAVAGDLRETFQERGRLWYWGQVLSCLAVFLSPHRRLLPGLGTDFAAALRRIRRNPGYSMIAMLCLALALGVNATLFSFLNSMYFRALPLPDSGRIVQITREAATFCNLQQFRSFSGRLRSVDAAGALVAFDAALVGRVWIPANMEMVTVNFGSVLRAGTTAGRWFLSGDEEAGAEPVAVVSYPFWKMHLGGDPKSIGQLLRIHEKEYRIIGIAQADFHGVLPPHTIDLWVPAAGILGRSAPLNLIARLAPGATLDSATAEMRVISASLSDEDPRDSRAASRPVVKRAIGFYAMRDLFLPLAKLLTIICTIVLLIACVNVANLLLSRAAVRQREMALRQSLGAGTWRLFRETLVEGLLLAGGGLALGLVAGYWTGRAIELALPSVPVSYYRGIQFATDWRVALFLSAAGIACAVLFSIPPALANRRNLHQALQGQSGRWRSRQREFYSLAQVALSLALLIAASLLLRALDRVSHIDPGFATDRRLFLTARAKGNPERVWTSALNDARALPGVRAATLSWGGFPGTGAGCAAKSEAEAPDSINHADTIRLNIVEPNYFEVMRIPIRKGRGFDRGRAGASPDVIVSETMARQWWPGEEAIGKRLWLGCSPRGRKIGEVVGIARDVKVGSLTEDPATVFYLSRDTETGHDYFALTLETAGEPREWLKPLLKLAEANPGLEIYEARTMDDAIGQSLWLAKWQASLLAGLGLLAIVLAAIGLYGVVAYTVSQQTREIGIRMALGAIPADVQWMVLGQGLHITLIGIGAGLVLSAAAVRLLRSFLYGLSPYDPVAFLIASLAWLLIAMLASWYPARRATRVDPLSALKYD